MNFVQLVGHNFIHPDSLLLDHLFFLLASINVMICRLLPILLFSDCHG